MIVSTHLVSLQDNVSYRISVEWERIHHRPRNLRKKKKEKREEKESVAFVPRGMIQRRVYIVFARGRSVADVYLATDATKANNENMCWMQEASLANLFLSARPIVRDLTLSVAIRRCLVALTRDSLLLHIAAGY